MPEGVILGHEPMGVVEEVGNGFTEFSGPMGRRRRGVPWHTFRGGEKAGHLSR